MNELATNERTLSVEALSSTVITEASTLSSSAAAVANSVMKLDEALSSDVVMASVSSSVIWGGSRAVGGASGGYRVGERVSG